MNLAENRELADLTALGGLDGVCQKLSVSMAVIGPGSDTSGSIDTIASMLVEFAQAFGFKRCAAPICRRTVTPASAMNKLLLCVRCTVYVELATLGVPMCVFVCCFTVMRVRRSGRPPRAAPKNPANCECVSSISQSTAS